MQNKKNFLIMLMLVVFLGAGLRIYNLGNTSFDRDEFFELNSSYGYFKTGTWVAWDFGNEKPFEASLQDKTSTERAEIYRWQLAQVYKFFEPTEISTRAISVFWGIVSILAIYFVTLSFTGNYWTALLATFLVAVGESGIVYSRRLRMYSMLFPVYLIFSWCVFKFYETKYIGKNKFFKLASDKLNVNLLYILPVIITGIVSYNVHMLSVSIVVAIFSFCVCSWFLWERKSGKINKYSITLGMIFIAYLIVSLTPSLAKFYKSFKKQVELFKFNYNYFTEYFTDFIFPIVGLVLALIGVWYLFEKMKRKKEAVFLFLSAFAVLAFAVFTWDRTPSGRYIYFIQSFGIILVSVGIYALFIYLTDYIKKHKKIAGIILLIFFLVLMDWSYFKKENNIYAHTKNSYYPDFKNIFPYILENKKDGDVFFTRSYRSYYWQGEKIKVIDLQSLPFEKKDCLKNVSEVMAKNPKGWFILPKIDMNLICKDGIKYLDDNFEKVKDEHIPTSVSVYRWGG